MRQESTVECTCTCPGCGTINTVVMVGLPPGTIVACSHCSQELGSIEDLVQSDALEPRVKGDSSV